MPTHRTDPDLLAVARGDKPADLLLTNARVVNVFTRELQDAAVAVYKGRIAGVGETYEARETVDLAGACIAPGLIDAHMHVESTMLLPPEFVRLAAPRGTTAVVLDPHEIANVTGIPGIRALMDLARALPMHLFFGASSCVPSSPLENSGARLEAADLEPLFHDGRVIALAEMMNFPGVAHADPGVLAKVRLGLERAVVDGHCPGMTGKPLSAYACAGITSDHECTTPEEALEKARLGMRIYLREGSAARNLEALIPAVTPENAHRFCFCTDDRHPEDLKTHGHIDHVVRRAVALGMDPLTALAIASIHAAEHYRLTDLGAIAPGRLADMIVLDDLRSLRVRRVYFQGRHIAEDGEMLPGAMPDPAGTDLDAQRHTVHLPQDLSEASFRVPAPPDGRRIRVIVANPHQIVTGRATEPPRVEHGACVADTERDILKMAVIGRHKSSGRIGLGFVRGFALARGALASTVGHDAHNLAVIGASDADMLTAARALERAGGGQCVVRDGKVLALLELPIAGLLSDRPAEHVIHAQRALLDAARATGCPLEDPFMPLSFLCLPVIPSLKLTDLGLVDVDRFEVVDLAAD